MKTKIDQKYLNFEYAFERRRYGRGSFYTWLLYRVIGTKTWQSYGDPWCKVRLNRSELNEALADIATRTIEPGFRVRTIVGDALILAEPTQPHCLAAQVEGYKTTMPLHPYSILEVL